MEIGLSGARPSPIPNTYILHSADMFPTIWNREKFPNEHLVVGTIVQYSIDNIDFRRAKSHFAINNYRHNTTYCVLDELRSSIIVSVVYTVLPANMQTIITTYKKKVIK